MDEIKTRKRKAKQRHGHAMETFEIRSKSYVVKWLNVPNNSLLKWTMKPLKNSINLGIFEKLSSDSNASANNYELSELKSGIINDDISLEDKLSLDLKLCKKEWFNKCRGGVDLQGEIKIESDSILAFVFDNTFSKTKAKQILFGYELVPMGNGSTLPTTNGSTVKFDISKNSVNTTTKLVNIKGIQYLEGYLMKKKRRKGTNKFTRRFFSLNINYSILYYYSNSNTNTIRGNMIINTTVISADSSKLILYLDSGVEQWILKCLNLKDFKIWIDAFNFIKNQNKQMDKAPAPIRAKSIDDVFSKRSKLSAIGGLSGDTDSNEYSDSNDEFEDADTYSGSTRAVRNSVKFDQLNEQLSSLKESVETLISEQEISAQGRPTFGSLNPSSSQISRKASKSSMLDNTAVSMNNASLSAQPSLSRRSSFLAKFRMRGHSSASIATSTATASKANELAEENEEDLTSTDSNSSLPLTGSGLANNKNARSAVSLKSILRQIDAIQEDFASLQSTLHVNALTRTPTINKSIFSQEFYDALEYGDETDQRVVMLDDADGDAVKDEYGDRAKTQPVHQETSSFEQTLENIKNSVSSSEDDDDDDDEDEDDETASETPATPTESSSCRVDADCLDLSPLPFTEQYETRNDIKPAACDPPSIISIMRKSVGKDLSSMSMPVSTNEPLSFLQKYCESLEYCDLVEDAINSPAETGERILKIAVFAISYLSAYRDKVRAIRKPFNPLLGETFELIDPKLNYRVVTEKVIHKPFVMAAHVDSQKWTIDHCICPQQKFYGKTAEIIVDGDLKLRVRDSNEVYSWNQPTTTIRNVVSLTGEKYTEPTENITVKSSDGYKCTVHFIPSNGRFTSSRSEKVELKVYRNNAELPLSATGAWTDKIVTNTGQLIWKVHADLPNHEKKYGFTRFACSLNNIDKIHEACAPTDSRHRPDQKLYENGNVDEADKIKIQLEEKQRLRRKDSSGHDVKHIPSFFQRGNPNDDLDWRFIQGDKNYWKRRQRGDWEGLVQLW